MSEQPSNTDSTPGLVVQTAVFLATVIGIPTAFALGGQLRSLALAAMTVLLLAGFLVVGYRHARRQGTLHHGEPSRPYSKRSPPRTRLLPLSGRRHARRAVARFATRLRWRAHQGVVRYWLERYVQISRIRLTIKWPR